MIKWIQKNDKNKNNNKQHTKYLFWTVMYILKIARSILINNLEF